MNEIQLLRRRIIGARTNPTTFTQFESLLDELIDRVRIEASPHSPALKDSETERLRDVLVAKFARLGCRGNDLETIVGTTIVDTLLVVEGVLSIEDFEGTRKPKP